MGDTAVTCTNGRSRFAGELPVIRQPRTVVAGHAAVFPRLSSCWPACRRASLAVRKRLPCAIGLGVSTLFLLTLIACVDPLWRPDDHGDTREAATDMEPAVPVSGRLETAADVDYFRVATGAAGVRVVASTDSQDTVVRIEGLVAASTNEDHLDWGDLPSPRPEHVHVRVSGAQPASYELAVWVVTAGGAGRARAARPSMA